MPRFLPGTARARRARPRGPGAGGGRRIGAGAV